MNETRIDETRRRQFEAALLAGASPRIDDFLPEQADECYHGTLTELIMIELEFRIQQSASSGEVIPDDPAAEYVARFPRLSEAAVSELESEARLIRESLRSGSSESASPSQDNPRQSSSVERLGEYAILREIGRGGMGVVYEAVQDGLDRHVALKVLPESMLTDSNLVARFQREARAAAGLHHTNIVPVFGVGESDERHFYAMQYIEGYPLDDILQELKQIDSGEFRRTEPSGRGNLARTMVTEPRQPLARETTGDGATWDNTSQDAPQGDAHSYAETLVLGKDTIAERDADIEQGNKIASSPAHPSSTAFLFDSAIHTGSAADSSLMTRRFWDVVARIGVQTAEALDYAHRHGILHRDIKPANLILDQTGNVWITDFGLARIDNDEGLTQTGDILGTLRYMPPEAFLGKSDAKSDQYSLGLTLYEFLTLQPAFEQSDRHQLIDQIRTGSVQRIEKVRADVPTDLATIIHKAIDSEPNGRYASLGELADDLRRFLDDEPIRARRITFSERLCRWAKKNKAIASLLATVATLLIAITIGATVVAGRMTELATDKTNETARATAALELAEQREQEADRRAEQIRKMADASRRRLYASQMVVASTMAEMPTGMGRVRELVDNWQPELGKTDLRGWEWYYLNGLSRQYEQQFPAPGGGDGFVVWSPDKKSLLASTREQHIRLSTVDGRVLEKQVFPGVTVSEWSDDESHVVTATKTHLQIRRWPTGEVIREIETGLGEVAVISLSESRKFVAATSFRFLLKVWDTETGTLKLERTTPPQGVARVDFRPGTEELLVLSHDENELIDINTLETIFRTTTASGSAVGKWNHAGSHYVRSSGTPGAIQIIDGNDGEIVAAADYSGPYINSFDWSPLGSHIAFGCADGAVRVIGSDTAEIVRTFRAQSRNLISVSWSPDGQRVASAGNSSPIFLWRFDQPAVNRRFAANYPAAADFGPHGNTVAVTGWNTIKLRDLESGAINERFIIGTGEPPFACVAFSPNGESLACLSRTGRLSLADSTTGKILVSLNDGGEAPLAIEMSTQWLTWSRDGRYLAAVVSPRQVAIWDVQTRKRLERPARMNRDIFCLAFDAAGKKLAVGGRFGTSVWHRDSGETIKLNKSYSYPYALAWNREQDSLIIPIGLDATFSLAELLPQRSEVSREFRGMTQINTSVDLSPDGMRLAAGSEDGHVYVWDTRTGELVAKFADYSHRCTLVKWSPDGKRLLTGGRLELCLHDARRGYMLDARE